MSAALKMPGGDERQSPGESPVAAGESGHCAGLGGTCRMASDESRVAAHPPSSPVAPERPQVSFEEFAVQYRQRQHKEAQRRILEHRLHATRVSIGLSARLLRIGTTVQRGLVESFKHGDKASFVTLYNTIHDIQEACDSASRRNIHREDQLEGTPLALDSERNRSSGFLHQLSPKSRTDLLEVLTLLRTDPQFLFERICSLTPSQLSTLVSSATSTDAGDSVFSATPRTRSQFLFSKRNSTHSALFKDHALAFERTDPLSALLFNVFAAPLDCDSAEAKLRLDVWSSTCAKLISHGGNRYYSLVGHILSSWAACSDWKARSKFELYLMDVLQKGAFLLEHIPSPLGLDFGAESPDPLRTEAAEEFFESAVQNLFEVLDDPDGGFPHGALEFGNAVLGKLALPEIRDRFLQYIFVQWFFSKFLHNALLYPETHGLLLDFHIGKDAREKLLGEIGLRAQSQVFRVLHSLPQFSANPNVRKHVVRMLSRFTGVVPQMAPVPDGDPSMNFTCSEGGQSSPVLFLMLSATDIVAILNALFPKPMSTYDPSPSPGIPTLSFSSSQSHNDRPGRMFEPNIFQGRVDAFSAQSPSARTVFTTEMNFQDATRNYNFPGDQSRGLPSQPQNSLVQNVNRIRFELSDTGESDDRPNLDHPSSEDWAILSISHDGKSLSWTLSPEDQSENLSDDGLRSTITGSEENQEALQTAIMKLVDDFDTPCRSVYGLQSRSTQQTPRLSLKQRFDDAMSLCQHNSDFIGAHYWWNASRLLLQGAAKLPQRPVDDSWILGPMLASSERALALSRSIVEQCESSFVTLDRTMEQMQTMVKGMMRGLAKLRNKMWYMTDVKNSMRYEDAKHVALALKTMVYPPSLHRQPTNEYRPRNGTRSLASSLLQKPEMQVMNVMKAPSSQGGPNKLSDEQVELTRKWLTHHGIDNFCKGEERIHRFCYEVKSSINKLVGDTMAEAPVLWASELFQKERAMYEGPGTRAYPGISSAASIRPSSITSEDSLYGSQYLGSNLRVSDSVFRSQHEAPTLIRKSSFQSLASDKWRSPRDYSTADTSSIGDSPGRAPSSLTADSYSTFWSAPHTQTHSATSASSFQSRPPSSFGDILIPPRRNDRNVHGKSVFLDELRQTLTSLLLSDLGSPVWSCGSETDAWFTDFLNQERIQAQMDKRAKIQKFLAECDSASNRQANKSEFADRYLTRRRSRSAGPTVFRHRKSEQAASTSAAHHDMRDNADRPTFAYDAAFRQLIEIFSRHANPFVKLKALRDLKVLVIASLNSSSDGQSTSTASGNFNSGKIRTVGIQQKSRTMRYSFSEPSRRGYSDEESLQMPMSPMAESIGFGSRRSDDMSPTESQIINAMKDLLREIKPKTLFRDLQFISAFVPSEILNKTESGTAFLHFGLAALSLKDEVCDSMVEIADQIVSQELSRRHPQVYDGSQRPGRGIEDAARMWIITAKEGNPVAQRELAILYLTHPELLPKVTLPLTLPRDTFKAEMMYRRDKDSKSDPQSMCLALHWMQLSANGGDELARNRLREREEFDSIA